MFIIIVFKLLSISYCFLSLFVLREGRAEVAERLCYFQLLNLDFLEGLDLFTLARELS